MLGRRTGAGAEGDSRAQRAAATVRSEIVRGPVRVTVEAAPSPAQLSDQLALVLTTVCPAGMSIRGPVLPESIGDFLVRDPRQSLPQSGAGNQTYAQSWILEPTRAGKLRIPSLSVVCTETRPAGAGNPAGGRPREGDEMVIKTEGLVIEVTSVVASDFPDLFPDLDAIRPPSGPIDLPEEAARGRGWLLLLVVIPASGVALWVWRRVRRAVSTGTLSPRQAARRELQRLLDEGLAERDVKLFYGKLTAVVRGYLAEATGIQAAEQTTEEFLDAMDRRGFFRPQQRLELRNFLESADLVKFGGRRPRRDAIAASVERANIFLKMGSGELQA